MNVQGSLNTAVAFKLFRSLSCGGVTWVWDLEAMPKHDLGLLIFYLFNFPSSSLSPDMLSEPLLKSWPLRSVPPGSHLPTSWLTNHHLPTGTFQKTLWCILAQPPVFLPFSLSGLCCSSWRTRHFLSLSSTRRGWTCSARDTRLSFPVLLWIKMVCFCSDSCWWQGYPSWHCECRCGELENDMNWSCQAIPLFLWYFAIL